VFVEDRSPLGIVADGNLSCALAQEAEEAQCKPDNGYTSVNLLLEISASFASISQIQASTIIARRSPWLVA
jgi:hypothetical protein